MGLKEWVSFGHDAIPSYRFWSGLYFSWSSSGDRQTMMRTARDQNPEHLLNRILTAGSSDGQKVRLTGGIVRDE